MKVPPLHALDDKLYRADILSHAWRLVKANKGSPGIDGIDFATIENGIGVDGYLLELSLELQDKTYRASTVRRIMIPKVDGSMRPVGAPHFTPFVIGLCDHRRQHDRRMAEKCWSKKSRRQLARLLRRSRDSLIQKLRKKFGLTTSSGSASAVKRAAVVQHRSRFASLVDACIWR